MALWFGRVPFRIYVYRTGEKTQQVKALAIKPDDCVGFMETT